MYLERIALPPATQIVVRLLDVSGAGAAATLVAGDTQVLGDRQVPIPFEIGYDPLQIDGSLTYAVQGILLVDGEIRFRSIDSSPREHGGQSVGRHRNPRPAGIGRPDLTEDAKARRRPGARAAPPSRRSCTGC